VIGKGGEQVKKVGMAARAKLEEFLQSKVFLDLQGKLLMTKRCNHCHDRNSSSLGISAVKVNKDWRKNEDQLKAYGYLKS
jgi:GTPase Era involved in 16S rRNA processing